ncbi:hypothetical protein MIR68_010168 [Amoeboaphelidium protococcarum]|nr:hypothetical protein MIR68_010168 [Amoeboaphelidium protococcarum]
MKLFVGLRAHRKSVTQDEDSLRKIVSKVESCVQHLSDVFVQLKDHVQNVLLYIAIDGADLKLYEALSTMNTSAGIQCTVIKVLPFESSVFTPALNQLLNRALTLQCQLIYYQSLEVEITPRGLLQLINCIQEDSNVLCCGAALSGHEYLDSVGSTHNVQFKGTTIPWNTCCVWNVAKLGITGFLPVSDGHLQVLQCSQQGDNNTLQQLSSERLIGMGGIEEGSVIAVHHRLNQSIAVLKNLAPTDVSWNTGSFGSDQTRVKYHQDKMASKNERLRIHLNVLGISEDQLYNAVRHQ